MNVLNGFTIHLSSLPLSYDTLKAYKIADARDTVFIKVISYTLPHLVTSASAITPAIFKLFVVVTISLLFI